MDSINNWKRKNYLAIALIAASSIVFLFYKFDYEHPLDFQAFSDDATNHTDSFADTMKSFQWDAYNTTIKFYNFSNIQHLSSLLMLELLPFLKSEPRIPPNKTCMPPRLQMPPPKSSGITCSLLAKPRKVGILLQFGFDVDSLEIHLHELDSLVDKFFILESVATHSNFLLSKPLLWDDLKFTERFFPFFGKIVHFTVDHSDLSKANPKKAWSRENLQENQRWLKFLEWNAATKYFQEDDLLGFGDTDEIPSRDNVNFLKNCQFPTSSVDIGIWFPLDGPNTIFHTDFPVQGHPFTLGDPTFWTLRTAMQYYKNNSFPTRMRGQSPAYFLGGLHLSTYAYPPFQLAKLLSHTEGLMYHLKSVIKVGKFFAEGKTRDAEKALYRALQPSTKPGRLLSLPEFKAKHPNNFKEVEAIVKIPWFLNCNRKRYPGFYREHDSRLDKR